MPLCMDDVDTDQIIPARFLTGTGREGYGENLLRDLRFDAQGKKRPEFILNDARYQGGRILLAGKNFGCGSSREHAVWALQGYGFKAVIAISFGDIFRNNAYKNGLLPIQLPKDIINQMHVDAAANPQEIMVVHLERQVVQWKGREYSFDINPFVKACILKGVDEIGYTLGFDKEIIKFEKT